ncbi:hypothetical protein [Legionella gresilensis]|uniref:hypothetical protein n=1 Tax=Legionella gresilensis TaxID=91823 RepID=UPI0010414F14|nr:hypothetical protein [Legionella gresilensis]
MKSKQEKIKLLFFMSLILSSQVVASNVRSKDTTDDQDNDNPMSYNPVCNTHGFFANRIVGNYWDSSETHQRFMEVSAIRSQNLPKMDEKASFIDKELSKVKDTLFEGNKNFENLRKYFRLVSRAVEAAKIRRQLSSGYCGEAAAASIVNSLHEQLLTGHRETVQEILIVDADKNINHAFVLYNAERLSSQRIDNNKLKEILNNIKSANKDKPIICDEFEQYYGLASKWYEKFFNAEDHNFGKAQYVVMEVTEYTLPPLNKVFNNPQRKFLKQLLMDLLSEVPVCSLTGDRQDCPSDVSNNIIRLS